MPFNQTGNENLGIALGFMKEFDAENLNEKICEIKSLQLSSVLGFIVCQHCNHHQILEGELQRMYPCKICSKEIWLTAGSFFDHVRKFRPYLAAFYLLERGVILSACEVAKVLGVSKCTADRIYKKIAKLVSEKMQTHGIDVSTAELAPVVTRRTTETPARQPPLAEEIAVQNLLSMRELEVEEQDDSRYPGISNSEKSVLALLSETPIRFADICEKLSLNCGEASAAIMGLELRALTMRLPGERYVILDRPTRVTLKAINNKKQQNKGDKIATRIIDFVKERFQGVGRKYLQLYAALYWIFIDRKSWGPGSIQQLCTQSRHIPYREILAFVTPPTVKVLAHV